jgi:hypothetical protein
MNGFRSLTTKLIAGFAVLLFFVAGCGSPPPPPPAEESLADPPPNFSAMRISGRESLEIAPGVRVHADHREQASGGIVIFTGRVYLDGTGQAEDSRWPWHAYAGKAEWHPTEGGALILSGGVSAERGHAVWQGKGEESTITVDGKKILTHGPMKTFLTLGTHGEKGALP